ncbi:peptidoglycan editing factor PgeF [Limibaculum sp. M0105]|uniref:Purine nucleoside phosphorylase n=1 Tax=Thermohalobaculum xanthum TaxID=2753746 RepID=A0A8J7M836_9RHOB|nr:peptidoglycan editing factor PgeF [Thermohalobaculum xanthum]MBK0399408.1 peptidoglycan editing factor PgeF [Thermohalobaculum xanthum]
MTLSPITAPEMRGIAHGFFTRKGGVSQGIYAGLNCGPGSGDDAGAVAENRERVTAHFGAATLVSLHQIHSADVVTVAAPWGSERPRADAMVTDRPGIALGVLTADCAPVLFADREAGVIGAAHAGWKGAIGGVAEATLEAMERLGAQRQRVVAVIGPTISLRAYEVGPEFVERFIDEDPDHARFFAGGAGDRAMFDLPGFLLARLREAGVADAAWTGHCTYSDEASFYSYRRAIHRDEPDYGRLVAAIML